MDTGGGDSGPTPVTPVDGSNEGNDPDEPSDGMMEPPSEVQDSEVDDGNAAKEGGAGDGNVQPSEESLDQNGHTGEDLADGDHAEAADELGATGGERRTEEMPVDLEGSAGAEAGNEAGTNGYAHGDAAEEAVGGAGGAGGAGAGAGSVGGEETGGGLPSKQGGAGEGPGGGKTGGSGKARAYRRMPEKQPQVARGRDVNPARGRPQQQQQQQGGAAPAGKGTLLKKDNSPQKKNDSPKKGSGAGGGGASLSPNRTRVVDEEWKEVEEWVARYDEVGPQYNNISEILRVVHLASKSTKLDMAKMGAMDPLPVEVYTIYYLKQMVLNDNNLMSISPLIGNPRMRGLMQLNLANNLLTKLPEEVSLLVDLHFLVLHNNHLVSIHPGIAGLTNLHRLTLHQNQLTWIPVQFYSFQHLDDFTWLDNPFNLPPSIWGVKFQDKLYFESVKLKKELKKDRLSQNEEIELERKCLLEARNRVFDFLSRLYHAPLTKSLNLDDLELTRIPWYVFELTGLTQLSLARNKIATIPPGIRTLGPSLTSLDLSHNRLCSIPLDLRFLTKLEDCVFTGMEMEFVPKVIRMAGVKNMLRFIASTHEAMLSGTLYLTDMGLTEVPEEVLAMTNLTELHLDQNKIKEITPLLTVLSDLKVFSANDNLLRTIPFEFEQLVKLERVSLLGCPIDELPLGLCKMTSLTELRSYSHSLVPKPPEEISVEEIIDRTFNLLDTFEHMIKAYETRTLILSDMGLSFFPNEAFQISTLTVLDISMNEFSKVPSVIGNLNNLTSLRLGFNFLTEVAFTWAQMSALESLHLQNNKLEVTLGPQFGCLTNLTEFLANDNMFSALPIEMSTCRSLRMLDLSFNRLEFIPPFKEMTNITHVDLRHNRLQEAPRAAFGHCSSLTFLDLSFNEIARFPTAGAWPMRDQSRPVQDCAGIPLHELIDKHYSGEIHVVDLAPRTFSQSLLWGNLKSLRLHSNRLTVLPWELWRLTSVEELSYDPATILIPAQEIVVRGWGFIRAYLRRWHDACLGHNLNIASFKLHAVPSEVFLGGSCLTRLSLAHNCLVGTVDPNLSSLTNLWELDLSHNYLVDIHYKIATLTKLCQNWHKGKALTSEGAAEAKGGLRWQHNKWRSPPQPVRLKGTRYIFSYIYRMQKGYSDAILELPSFDLKHFPYEAMRLTNLTTLNLEHNFLSAVPPTVTNLMSLKVLLLNNNRLVWVHNTIGQLQHLQTFNVADNQLEVLPHELSAISSLTSLPNAGNRMGGPPEGVRIRLDTLVLARMVFPTDAWVQEIMSSGDRPEVAIVYLRNFLVARGNASMGITASLDLDLRALCMTYVPREVADLEWAAFKHQQETLTRIQTIRLDCNPFPRLPTHVTGWEFVQTLTVNDCMLRSIEPCFADPERLPHLTHLEATDNSLRTFPAFPGAFPSLTTLTLDRNDLTTLPAQIGWISTLENISLRQNKISLLPSSVWRLQKLKVAHLEDNLIIRLPADLGALAARYPARDQVEMKEHLERGGPELDYVARPPGTPLPAMPEDKKGLCAWRAMMGGCEQEGESNYGALVTLAMKGNDQIWSPPPEVVDQGDRIAFRYLRAFFDARHTRSLDLHDLALQRLPPETLEMGWWLQHLWLSYNDLESLPVCVEELTALKTLHLHHNRIKRLPPTVGLCLLELTDLDISHNNMTRVPLEFANLKKLSRFELRANPWEMIPDEMIGQGTMSLINFLQNVKDSIHGVLDLAGMTLTSFGLTYVKKGVPDHAAVHTIQLEDNLVRVLPRPFHMMSNVTSLCLDRNQFTELPSWIPEYSQLRKLSLSKNKMEEVEPNLGECRALEKAFFDGNYLEYVPATFGLLTNLQMLRLDCNKLLVVNPCLGFMHSLTRLWLGLNALTMLPPELSYCTALTDLRLDNNPLKSPPRVVQIGGCDRILSYLGRLMVGKQNLEVDFSHFGLLTVPFEVTYLSNITRLNLDNNKLRNLWPIAPAPAPTERDKALIVGGGYWAYRLYPEQERRAYFWEEPEDPLREVGPMDGLPTPGIPEYPVHLLGNLVNLQMLAVRNNQISELPGKCFPRWQTSLRELYLDGNRITILPFEMHTLDVLESFSTGGNPVGHPPVDYDKEGFPTLRKYWKRIEAAGKTGICELVNMSLLLFPREFYEDPKLANGVRYLDLSGNRIPNVSKEIEKMTALETLRLEDNLLETVPGELFSCTNLVELNLEHNTLSELPTDIGNCTRLTYLFMSHNRLTTLPDEMAGLTGLVKLALSNNELTLGTAWWLACLTNLQSLLLNDNLIMAIPVAVGMLSNLDELRIEGNDLKDPPANVIAGGIKAIRDYLGYNVRYETDQPALAPPRPRHRIATVAAVPPQLVDAAALCKATASSTAGNWGVHHCLDGGKSKGTFWQSGPMVDNVLLDVDLGTKFSLQRIELHWRSNFSPRRYTVEVSEEGRQWFLVYRSIVHPDKGEGDEIKPEEKHITDAHMSYGTDRVDTVWLRDDGGMVVRSALPSTGIQWIRVHMTKRWFSSYRLNFLRAWGNRIEGASYVTATGKDASTSFRDA